MKRALLVDDNLAVLKQVALQLADSYHVLMAKSGPQALTMAAKDMPDIILLDVEMPGMDGFATIAALRDDPDLNHVPVIFLTANHDVETQIRALRAGGVDFITKPFNRDVLLHRMALHISLAEYQFDLEKNIRSLEDSIITSFAELVECKDDHAGGHVQRTREHVALLAHLLLRNGLFTDELNEASIRLMARAAPLHDIGKVGVSDLIMLKPGKLTDEEYTEAKRHATIGAETLRAIYGRTPMPVLQYAILLAEGHHERFDGAGYPKGLKGEDIPLCARLMAVANVYDALISETVFRPAMSHDEACRIIAEGAGHEFDPRITAIFLKNHSDFARITART